jgi:hypothetical protein
MVEGVSGRGNRRSSRGGGESGLGQLTGGHQPPSIGDGGVRVAAGPPPRLAKRRPWSGSQLDEAGVVA